MQKSKMIKVDRNKIKICNFQSRPFRRNKSTFRRSQISTNIYRFAQKSLYFFAKVALLYWFLRFNHFPCPTSSSCSPVPNAPYPLRFFLHPLSIFRAFSTHSFPCGRFLHALKTASSHSLRTAREKICNFIKKVRKIEKKHLTFFFIFGSIYKR